MEEQKVCLEDKGFFTEELEVQTVCTHNLNGLELPIDDRNPKDSA